MNLSNNFSQGDEQYEEWSLWDINRPQVYEIKESDCKIVKHEKWFISHVYIKKLNQIPKSISITIKITWISKEWWYIIQELISIGDGKFNIKFPPKNPHQKNQSL